MKEQSPQHSFGASTEMVTFSSHQDSLLDAEDKIREIFRKSEHISEPFGNNLNHDRSLKLINNYLNRRKKTNIDPVDSRLSENPPSG